MLSFPFNPSKLIRRSLDLISWDWIDKFSWIIFWLNIFSLFNLHFLLRILNILRIIMTFLFLQILFIFNSADYTLIWISHHRVSSFVLQCCHAGVDWLYRSDFLNFLHILNSRYLPIFIVRITFFFEFYLETLIRFWIVYLFIFCIKFRIFFLQTFRFYFLILI